MGFRAAGLAQLHFEDVEVPAANIVGKPGLRYHMSHRSACTMGESAPPARALGLLRGCFEESTAYAGARKIGDEQWVTSGWFVR